MIPWRVQEIGVVDLEEKKQIDFLGKKEVKAVLTQSMFEIELNWRVKLKSLKEVIWNGYGEGRKDKGLNQISNSIHQWQSPISSAFAMSPTATWNFVTVGFQASYNF